MKIVLVQLSHEARKVAVLEMLRENGFGEFFVLYFPGINMVLSSRLAGEKSYLKHYKAVPFVAPSYNRRVGGIFQHPESAH